MLIVSVVFVAIAATASPAPAGPPNAGAEAAITTLPCRVGDTWTYSYSAKTALGKGLNGSETWTRATCGAREIAHPSGKLIKADVVESPDGLLYAGFSSFSGDAQDFKTPLAVAHFPLAPGTAWDASIDSQIGDRAFTGTSHWKATGWEKITVPAGTYDSLRLEVKSDVSYEVATRRESRMETMNETINETRWYSPDARTVVKSVRSDTFGNNSTIELTAATLQ